MSPSERETLEISLPASPPGIPPLVRERLRQLGPGQRVTRKALAEVCGGPSPANHFIDDATQQGFLVPTAWGEYQVPEEPTLRAIGQIANPVYRRFLAWATLLPKAWGAPVLFLGPRLWRDTPLNIDHPFPVIPVGQGEASVTGAPPQWGAFFFDVTGTQAWELRIGDDRFTTFQAPGLVDAIVLLRAGLDPRWRAAAADLEDRLEPTERARVREVLLALHIEPAPRGHRHRRALGAGPPHRYRLLYPKWYGEMVRSRLPNLARMLSDVPAGDDPDR